MIPDFASSSASLILVHQLDDKLKAHECLVQFLKNVNLWDRVCPNKTTYPHSVV